jgi:hypothetical protein
MAHDPTGTRTVHLVGSVPLESAEMVFRSVSNELGPFVRRIPDGETGDRTGWVGFQIPMFTQHPAMELVPSQAKGEGEGNLDSVARGEAEDYTRPVFRLRPSANVAALSFDDLGYSTAARASYAVFAELRRAGAIRPGTRFQVSLPTPLAPLVMFVARRDLLAVEPAFRAAMLRELGQICSAIPHDDLAVQWDVAPEMALLEGVWESVLDDVESAVIERLVELGNAVPGGVALGYHLCYGDLGHQHFVQPKDMAVLVRTVNAIARGLSRQLDWVHLPVPRDRDDTGYFEPLVDLALSQGTELYLGVVHASDGVDGARRRITAARCSPADFGISTECGFGRRDPATIPALLELHRAVLESMDQ